MLMGADIFFQVLLPQSEQESSSLASNEQRTQRRRQQQHEETQSSYVVTNTRFGKIVAGALPADTYSNNNNVISLHCHTCDNNISELNETLKTFWKVEDVPQLINEQCSETEQAEVIFSKSVKLENQKFQVDLPLKVNLDQVNETLGSSFDLALFRFLSLEKRLHKNINLLTQYQKFIDEYIELGQAHYVNINSYDFANDPVYFLPHHPVINEGSKSTPVRVVFNGSMPTSKGLSLNDIQLNGPKVQRDLFEILMLFRFGDYMFTTDIRRMFRNIKLNPTHTPLQNILWRNNPQEPIQCICLDTVTYGLKSSSYLATRCLLELANRYEHDFPLASFVLKNCTYIDDVLYSNADLGILMETKRQLCEMLRLGSLDTHKWSSNQASVLSDIPLQKQHFESLDFEQDCNFNIKTLGLQLNLKQDSFIISSSKNQTTNKNITKSSILSCIARFYDPLGFASPIIVKAKAIMQQLWEDKLDWNAKPSEKIISDWLQFSENLASMQPIHLDRNIPISSTATAVQLIGFADASSSTGYGCCLYLRVVEKEGNVRTFLLCSKSRINPRAKPLTIPRLELNAALLLAKLASKVYSTLILKIKVDNVFLHSDSQIVLAWIGTDLTRLQAYACNRVRMITELTGNWKWLYVQSQDNPADLISRGVDPQALPGCALWWNGPAFLQEKGYKFENNKVHLPVENLPEMKSAACPTNSSDVVLITVKENEFLQSFINRYSDINRMTRILAYVMRFCDNLKLKVADKNIKLEKRFLSANELQKALLVLIRYDQSINFHNEIHALKSGKEINGSLKPLHPFIDKENILRVGGRLQNSDISYTQKHPIILVKGSYITTLIIRSEHARLLHAGPKLLLSSLNQKYWITNGIREVKKITHKCITCFKLKSSAAKQLMGSLPSDRVVQSLRAFQKVGMDFAGPVEVKQSRIRRSVTGKGYILVFVCFSTKAVHLELASDLSTATFLACFRRFISRRGLPSDCYCDNASTFRCASSQLNDLYKLLASKNHQMQVNNFASQNQVNFNFIPCYSPVFGGLWEAAVKSTKFHLKRVVQKSILTYEELNTVLVQIEGILNSRPLLPMTSNSDDFTYLTPGHFLIGTSLTTYPDHDVSCTPVNRLKMWNVCNNMVQSFWKLWYRHYLNVLQSRPKWQTTHSNITVGSLVLLIDNDTPPLTWPMARVTQVFPGKDNHVRAFEVMTPNRKTHIRSVTKVCVLPLN
ncbi:hypothetical protein ABMA27_013673 [Loxostege sticticalis]|uniref:Integrase catalytic domain-containing protein n=1 Tax=Loxostege sticticalis TaxID=481309 RepID=A0ABR3IB32_LOXSC